MAAGPPESIRKQLDYIKQLEDRNRIKSIYEANSVDDRRREERERGFQMHWSGANKTRQPAAKFAPPRPPLFLRYYIVLMRFSRFS